MFEGEVVADAATCFDDFVGQGGTIANLKGFIEARGGTAIGCTIDGKPWSAKLTPCQKRCECCERNMAAGKRWQDAFGYGFNFLTESEARYLARAD